MNREYVVYLKGHYAAGFNTKQEALDHKKKLDQESSLNGFGVYHRDEIPPEVPRRSQFPTPSGLIAVIEVLPSIPVAKSAELVSIK